MKMHFGFFEDCGSYETPLDCCEETLCGYPVGDSLEEYVTDCWNDISCKRCLRLKDAVVKGQEADEQAIIAQMGDMADFFKEEALLK